MATSANNWPVIDSSRTNGSHPRLRKWIIPGADRHIFARDGSAGFLLATFGLLWHEQIDPLDGGVFDEWGWAVRPVRGSTTGYSNHASGTAADFDATQFPRGIRIVLRFTSTQIRTMRKLIKGFDGALDWGGEWNRVPDGMHIEIAPGTSLTDAERVAAKIARTDAGARILAANPGAEAVIKDGNQFWTEKPVTTEPKPGKPTRGANVDEMLVHATKAMNLLPKATNARASWRYQIIDKALRTAVYHLRKMPLIKP